MPGSDGLGSDMGTVAGERLGDTALCAAAPPYGETSVQAFALRDGAGLYLIRPDHRSAASISLDAAGGYLCVGLVGELALWKGEDREALRTGQLHVLRQRAGAGFRRIECASPGRLAAVVFFSTRWCRSCPQGPTCDVGRFLLHGNGGRAGACDQAIELDETGLACARGLLDLHIEEDADTLSVERSVLALLSWAFARHADRTDAPARDASLPPRAAMKVRQAAEILRQRFEDPPTIAELSALIGLNESDLKRWFKSLYGDSIASYSRQRRLEAARDLLVHSSLGVASIALEVGFSNPSQFARAFRLQFGLNPSEYRRSPS